MKRKDVYICVCDGTCNSSEDCSPTSGTLFESIKSCSSVGLYPMYQGSESTGDIL